MVWYKNAGTCDIIFTAHFIGFATNDFSIKSALKYNKDYLCMLISCVIFDIDDSNKYVNNMFLR